jgi:hypothetical protein
MASGPPWTLRPALFARHLERRAPWIPIDSLMSEQHLKNHSCIAENELRFFVKGMLSTSVFVLQKVLSSPVRNENTVVSSSTFFVLDTSFPANPTSRLNHPELHNPLQHWSGRPFLVIHLVGMDEDSRSSKPVISIMFGFIH